MKKITFIIAFLLMMRTASTIANEDNFNTNRNGVKYLKTELIVKLSSQVDISIVDDITSRASKPSQYFGIPSLDGLLQPNGAISATKLFPSAVRLAASRNQTLPLETKSANELERYYKIEISNSIPIEKVKQRIERDQNVELVEYSYVYEPTATPNDALYSGLQHLPQIKAPEAWDIHKGENGPEVLIGINDTGCQWDHPDLMPNLKINYAEWTNRDVQLFITSGSRLVINPLAVDGADSDGNGYVDDVVGYNFFTSDGTPQNDPYGQQSNTHGTHVAGIAAGATNNSIGISSISWNVKFIPTKHSATVGAQYLYNLEEGLWYMATVGVNIVNMSWGGGDFSQMMVDLFRYMDDMGIILISSAGNTNLEKHTFPNSYPGIISVASVASNDVRAYYSTYGIQVDISAPGGASNVDGGVNSTLPMNTYGRYQGTSMASPLVAGLAGLMKSYYPNWTSKQIKKQLIGTSDNIYPQNPNLFGKLGAGRINSLRALTETNVTVSSEPRLSSFWTNFYNQNGSDIINPGDEINFGIMLRNYNMFYDAGALVFKLISQNSSIIPKNSSVTKYIYADDLVNVTGLSGTIQTNAKPAICNAIIRVENLDGNLIKEFPIQFNIAGGVLVYEFIQGSSHQSGTFIANDLTSKGYDVVYTNSIPDSFSGFDALFLSFGNYSQSPVYSIDNETLNKLYYYIVGGGKIFMDASTLISGQIKPNISTYDLNSLFGLSNATYNYNSFIPFNSVTGITGSIANGMTFNGTTQPNGYQIEQYYPSSAYGGSAMLSCQGYGNVGAQTSGVFGQKIVMMSFALAGFVDNNCPSTKSVLIDRITDFLGLVRPIKISMPSSFTVCQGTGSVILTPGNKLDCATNTMKNLTVTGGSGNYNIVWSPQSNLTNANIVNPTVSNLNNNTSYKLTITDLVYGTKAEFTTVVNVIQKPLIGVKTVVTEKSGTFRNLNTYVTNYSLANTYNWYKESVSSPISAQDALSWKVPYGTTRLFVEAVNSNGCKSSLSRVIVFGTLLKDVDGAISGLNNNSEMIVYPTVVSDNINVIAQFSEDTDYTVRIVDLLGNTVYNAEKGFSNQYESSINVSNMTSGTYMILIETSNDKIVKKFVKL